MNDIIAKGEKVLIREKRYEDGENDHNWRANPELAELDAAMPIRQSLKDFLRDYENVEF